MSDGLNRYMGLGNLCEDPVLRNTQGGQPVLNGRIAINGGYLDKDKTWQKTCEYVSFVLWGARAEGLAKILTKGKQIFIEGSLRTSSYDDREGNKKWKTEVNCTNVILTGNKDGGGGEGGGEEDAPPARGGGGGYQNRGGGQGGGGGQRSQGGGYGVGQRQSGSGGGQQRPQGGETTQRSQGGGGSGSGSRGGPPPPEADTQGDGSYGADDDIPFCFQETSLWRP